LPAVLVAIKAVPGARRDAVAGLLGDRLKVRVAAPPEDGKANKSICKLLAAALGLKPAALTVARGHASAEKTILASGITLPDAQARLAPWLAPPPPPPPSPSVPRP
jgi:uncharacterized protein (TIGR00251 family)